jgi:hypothetical protein
MEAYSGAKKALPEAMEAHPGTVKLCRFASEAWKLWESGGSSSNHGATRFTLELHLRAFEAHHDVLEVHLK